MASGVDPSNFIAGQRGDAGQSDRSPERSTSLDLRPDSTEKLDGYRPHAFARWVQVFRAGSQRSHRGNISDPRTVKSPPHVAVSLHLGTLSGRTSKVSNAPCAAAGAGLCRFVGRRLGARNL